MRRKIRALGDGLKNRLSRAPSPSPGGATLPHSTKRQQQGRHPAASERPEGYNSGTSVPCNQGDTPRTFICSESDSSQHEIHGSYDRNRAPTGRSLGDSREYTARDKPVWYAAIESILSFVERSSDFFPPLKSTAAAFGAILEAKDAFVSNQEIFEGLAKRIELLHDIMRDRPQPLPQKLQDRYEGLKNSVEAFAARLEAKTHRSGLERVVFGKDDQQEIVQLVREISLAIEITMLDVNIRNEKLVLRAVKEIESLRGVLVEETLKIQKDTAGRVEQIKSGVEKLNKAALFAKLGDVKHANWSNGTRRDKCVDGSRTSLLASLLLWAEDPSTPHTFWLSGMAGTGKTAVTESLCGELNKRGLLGASFFCSLTSQDRSDVRLIIPSLARALANLNLVFGEKLAEFLEDGLGGAQSPLDMPPEDQYQYLILDPAEAAFRNRQRPVVLCVDALDECNNSERRTLREFLDAIVLSKPTSQIKVFFTSRPESDIQERVESASYSSHRQLLRLHDIEKDMVRADIEMFVNHRLRVIPILAETYGDTWPPPEVNKIVDQSGTLFIVAATIVRYIDADRGDRLARFRSFGSADATPLSKVGELYQFILQRVFDAEEVTEEEREDTFSCLRLLVVARRPLTVGEYAALLVREPSSIRETFRPLHSVVQVPPKSEPHRAISIFHASFVDFLTSLPLRNRPLREWNVKRRLAQLFATEKCLELMRDEEKGVRFGVSGAVTSYRGNDDQPRPLALGPGLGYACSAWVDHAIYSKPLALDVQAAIKAFLNAKALFWIEALGVKKNVGYTRILWNLSKEVKLDGLKELLLAIRDFGIAFATPINHSIPHLYLSALPFVEAVIAGPLDWCLRTQFPSLPIVHRSNDSADIVIDSDFEVHSLAVSPDGTLVCAGMVFSIKIWNTVTGEHVLEIEDAHETHVLSVAFSNDADGGSRIVSGSTDETIRVWDTRSGKAKLEPLTGHTGSVTSVAFSPQSEKDIVVSGSDDWTVRLWDAKSGSPLRILEGHAGAVNSIAFSADGIMLVSGSDDTTIRVWNVESGETVAVLGPLAGAVRSVAVSPDGLQVFSASESETFGACHVWDIESQEIAFQLETISQLTTSLKPIAAALSPDGSRVAFEDFEITVCSTERPRGGSVTRLKGHVGGIMSLAFSPDGSKLVSGGYDYTLRVWDARSARSENGPSHGRSRTMHSVAFSPDCSRVISGSSDAEVQVWDPLSGKQVLGPLSGHQAEVKSVAFCRHGTTQRIISGSKDGTLRVWNADSGETVFELLGHSEGITSVAISPDGSRIVSGSFDGTAKVWHAKHGGAAMNTLRVEGRATSLASVAFSPEGSRIVSGSYSGYICVWDAKSGKQALEPWKGISGIGTCVAFSQPEGSRIASSGGPDRAIWVWDAESGQPLLGPLKGHSDRVRSVAFSPDGSRLVSASDDKTIRLWDATTGRALLSILEGHSAAICAVTFSPDGTAIASGSEDGTVRIWAADAKHREPPATQSFLHNYPSHRLRLDIETGWICNSSGDLLLWVPPRYRHDLHTPILEQILGESVIQVELTHAIYHGHDWKRCSMPRREPAVWSRWAWPIHDDIIQFPPENTSTESPTSFAQSCDRKLLDS